MNNRTRCYINSNKTLLLCLFSFVLGGLVSHNITVSLEQQEIISLNMALTDCRQEQARGTSFSRIEQESASSSNSHPSMQGMVRVSKSRLLSAFDTGLPRHEDDPKMVVRNNNNKFTGVDRENKASDGDIAWILSKNSSTPLSSPADHVVDGNAASISQCDSMDIVILPTKPSNDRIRNCLAIAEDPSSTGVPHLHRFLDTHPIVIDHPDDNGNKPQEARPLQQQRLTRVGRGASYQTFVDWFPPALEPELTEHRQRLVHYLQNLDSLLRYVGKAINNVLRGPRREVLAMVVNYGQSDLLHNFVCTCRAKNLPLDRLVVFSTDEQAHNVVQGLGVLSIYHKDMFGGAEMPIYSADRFSDATFQSVVFGKLVVPHLLSCLKVNFLFQDVDVQWYQNPLDMLDPLKDQYDLLFQHDGSDTLMYAPYFANSGFFYATANAKSHHFFRQLVYNADSMARWQSDQGVFAAFLPASVDLMGLKVKTLSQRDYTGGSHFEMVEYRDFMRSILIGDHLPVTFHAHWTKNKQAKMEHLKQLGLWFLGQKSSDSCDSSGGGGGMACCLSQPHIECRYSDRPSVPSCKGATNMTTKSHGKLEDFW